MKILASTLLSLAVLTSSAFAEDTTPSREQTKTFLEDVSNDHSWYKHLPRGDRSADPLVMPETKQGAAVFRFSFSDQPNSLYNTNVINSGVLGLTPEAHTKAYSCWTYTTYYIGRTPERLAGEEGLEVYFNSSSIYSGAAQTKVIDAMLEFAKDKKCPELAPPRSPEAPVVLTEA